MGSRHATHHSTQFGVRTGDCTCPVHAAYVFIQASKSAALIRKTQHMGSPWRQLDLEQTIVKVVWLGGLLFSRRQYRLEWFRKLFGYLLLAARKESSCRFTRDRASWSSKTKKEWVSVSEANKQARASSGNLPPREPPVPQPQHTQTLQHNSTNPATLPVHIKQPLLF